MEIRASAEFEERITCAVDERLVAATRGARYMRLSKTKPASGQSLERQGVRRSAYMNEGELEEVLPKHSRPETRPQGEID